MPLKRQSRRKGKRQKTAKAETTTKASDFSKLKERGIPAKMKLQSNRFHKHLCSRKGGMNSWFFNSFTGHQKKQKIWKLLVSRKCRLSYHYHWKAASLGGKEKACLCRVSSLPSSLSSCLHHGSTGHITCWASTPISLTHLQWLSTFHRTRHWPQY